MAICKNEIILKNIDIEKKYNRWMIKYEYNAPEMFMRYVTDKSKTLFVEFEAKNDIEIPKAVLTIPFVGVMLTVAMLLDISIRVETLDSNFFSKSEKY